MKVTPVHRAVMQTRRRQTMYQGRNKYDDAYVMGYHNGYHGLTYDNQYDKNKQAQYHIKFKMGYVAGELLRTNEGTEQ